MSKLNGLMNRMKTIELYLIMKLKSKIVNISLLSTMDLYGLKEFSQRNHNLRQNPLLTVTNQS